MKMNLKFSRVLGLIGVLFLMSALAGAQRRLIGDAAADPSPDDGRICPCQPLPMFPARADSRTRRYP